MVTASHDLFFSGRQKRSFEDTAETETPTSKRLKTNASSGAVDNVSLPARNGSVTKTSGESFSTKRKRPHSIIEGSTSTENVAPIEERPVKKIRDSGADPQKVPSPLKRKRSATESLDGGQKGFDVVDASAPAIVSPRTEFNDFNWWKLDLPHLEETP